MFFGLAFAVFILLSGYAGIRVRSLFETARQKNIFSILFVLVVFSFPAAEMLSHAHAPAWAHPLLFAGYFSLPFLLYLVLLVLLHDILRGVNRLVKAVPPNKFRTHGTRLIIIVVLLSVPVLIVLVGYLRNSELRVNEYHVEVSRHASTATRLRIAVASDFHLGEITSDDLMPRFADKINALGADLLVVPGDLLEGDRRDGRVDQFAREFHRIHTRYGVYGSLGNHESYGRGDKLGFFRDAGIVVLQDSAARIDDALFLIGRKEGRTQGRKPMEELLRDIPDSLPIIVLDHKPTDLQAIAASRANIVICGHSHHGQLWPLNLITDNIYDVSWGHKRLGDLDVFVTSGVQVWGPPVRTSGDSEIMLITVQFISPTR